MDGKYFYDTAYDVWRSGGNPDQVDYGRVNDHFHDGLPHEEAASREMRRLYPQPQEEAGEEPNHDQL